MDNYLQGNHSSSETPQTHSPASTMPAPAPPVRSYTYQNTTSPSGAPIRFIDSNPRPAKSPRHQAPPELNSSFSSDFTARFNAPTPYSSASDPAQPREYFPTSMSMQPWTTAQDTASTYGTTLPAVTSSHYEYHGDQHYVKEEGHSQAPPPHQQPSQQHYTWSAA